MRADHTVKKMMMKNLFAFGLAFCMILPAFSQNIDTKKMPERIHTSFWNYNKFSGFRMEMLHDWVNCGMTLPVSPLFEWKNDSAEDFLQMLDEAEKLGVQMIIQVDVLFIDNDAEQYRKTATEVYEKFGKHPAVCGVYIGEEPNTHNDKSFHECTKIFKEIAPELTVYINLGSPGRMEGAALKGKLSLTEWMRNFTQFTGSRVIGFGEYDQMIPGGIKMDNYFTSLRESMEAANASGMELWATLLSSAHGPFEAPTEDQYRWQLNTAVACGCKAVVWFRLYDKLVALDYRNSPIDEFGEKTTYYYNLRRVQKRFNIHHGEIFARLQYLDTCFIDTYSLDVCYGGYKKFEKDSHDLVANAESPHGMISDFKDSDGNDYIVILNTSQTIDRPIKLTFSEKVNSADILYYNGDMTQNIFRRNGQSGGMTAVEIWLAPGQMELIKIN
ncbi:MAG: hypothetical protein FWH27_13275 [Planctomycetaceae bacterium]|nr:hypothetical protein [Planctomycetaceae bacterium]